MLEFAGFEVKLRAPRRKAKRAALARSSSVYLTFFFCPPRTEGAEGAQPLLRSFPEPFTLSSDILPCASLGFAIAHDW
jgi:hypothetical protein